MLWNNSCTKDEHIQKNSEKKIFKRESDLSLSLIYS